MPRLWHSFRIWSVVKSVLLSNMILVSFGIWLSLRPDNPLIVAVRFAVEEQLRQTSTNVSSDTGSKSTRRRTLLLFPRQSTYPSPRSPELELAISDSKSMAKLMWRYFKHLNSCDEPMKQDSHRPVSAKSTNASDSRVLLVNFLSRSKMPSASSFQISGSVGATM